ncbi:MAG: GNAT family N-acetyltransferase [Firmicutes bacterium]|nr:GNAT family N-acetyltransferase [Bacillota bacterium]
MYMFSQLNENNFIDMARLQLDAYPSTGYNTTVEKYAERIAEVNKRKDINFYGAYKGDRLVGSYSAWDFDMNMRQIMIKAGGIGSVAVDLAHKKEKICREIVKKFTYNLRGNGINMAMLYPFNSAFYYRMGFGFGTLLQQFKLKPENLPGGNSKAHIVRLYEDSAESLAAFYNSRVKLTHGLIMKTADEFASRLKNPVNKIFAYVAPGGEVCGYIVFQFKKGSEESFLVNDMIVSELLFSSPEAFTELMTFVKSQSDQVRYVIINTQDEGLINAIADPRNHTDRVLFSAYQECCQTGLGIMYRICDVGAFIKEISGCKFGELNMKLRLNVTDTFVPENNKPFMLEFIDGQCSAAADDTTPDAELTINIAELSSIIMGCTNLKHLVKYGKASLSGDSYLDVLSRAFSLDEKPVCLTHF